LSFFAKRRWHVSGSLSLSPSTNHEGSKRRIYQKKGASRHIEIKTILMLFFSLSRKEKKKNIFLKRG